MHAAGNFAAPFRAGALLLTLLAMLAVVAACQDRRATQRYQETTPLPQARESTPRAATTPSTPFQERREMAVNRIAYIGSDGNVFTIKPDGTDSRRLTTTDLRAGPGGHILAQVLQSQVFYASPTWSADSTKLAVSRITFGQASTSFSLEVVDASTGETTKIYENEPNTLPIAQGVAHYMYWSPDSNHLTFIAATPGELALFLAKPEEGRAPTRLLGKGPIYFSWSRDSSALLIHRLGELLLASPTDGGPGSPQSLGAVSVRFRAPALSHDASKMVFVAGADGADALYLADTQPFGLESSITKPQLAGARPIQEVGPFSAFLWSPSRDEVAVADTTSSTGTSYERLTIVSGDGASRKSLVNEPMLAFFWSPDGEKIVYVAFEPDQGSLTWKYVERSGGTPKELAGFVPSAEFLTMISFFDQYAYSNSIWSPDSSQIVFSGTIGPSALSRNGGSPEEDKVYVLDVREGATPREIATSRFATWSWR